METRKAFFGAFHGNAREDEKYTERRHSLRERKKTKYKAGDYVHVETGQQRKETLVGRKCDPIIRGLPVICGTKLGLLDVKLLEKGEACIKCEGQLLTPPAFECHAGKSAAKKWKASIFYKRKPLTYWFEKGHLSTIGYVKKSKEENILPLKSKPDELCREMEITDETEDKELSCDQEPALKSDEEKKNGVEDVCETNGEKNCGEDWDDDVTDISDLYNEDYVTQENFAPITSSPEKFNLQKEVKIVIERLPVLKPRRNSQLNSTERLPEVTENESLGRNNRSTEPTDDSSLTSDDCISLSGLQHHYSCAADGDDETDEETQEALKKSLRKKNQPMQIKTEASTYEDNQDEEMAMSHGYRIKRKVVGGQQVLTLQFNNQSNAADCNGEASGTQDQSLVAESIVQPTQNAKLHKRRHKHHTCVTSQSERMRSGERAPNTTDASLRDFSSSNRRSNNLQMKREKLEMQLRVLKVQEEYYTAKLNALKQFME